MEETTDFLLEEENEKTLAKDKQKISSEEDGEFTEDYGIFLALNDTIKKENIFDVNVLKSEKSKIIEEKNNLNYKKEVAIREQQFNKYEEQEKKYEQKEYMDEKLTELNEKKWDLYEHEGSYFEAQKEKRHAKYVLALLIGCFAMVIITFSLKTLQGSFSMLGEFTKKQPFVPAIIGIYLFLKFFIRKFKKKIRTKKKFETKKKRVAQELPFLRL